MKRTNVKKTYKFIAEVIRYHRKKKGIRQVDLAEAIGYKSGQYISNVERGMCVFPVEKLYQLATVLDAQPLDFIDAMAKDYAKFLTDCYDYDKKRSVPPELPFTPDIIKKREPTRYYPHL